MSRLCIDLPPFAPDYSGAASAFFDLGGIIVMHDASGCTGNYTGYDEPRWIGSKSAVFCSGLRRIDAVMGNDEAYIKRTVDAANILNPKVIAYLGSPVPMVIGIDLEGMAYETENMTGVPSFGINTTGEKYYDKGASDVFVKLIRRFAKKPVKKEDGAKKSVNLFGMIPLDVGNTGNCNRILTFVRENGFEITADFAMGLSVEQIEKCPSADLNIVVSRCGLEAARYLKRKYQIPYVCGVPLGDGENLLKKIRGEQEEKEQKNSCSRRILIIHEQIMANSLREKLEENGCTNVTVASFFGLEKELQRAGDLHLKDEAMTRKILNKEDYDVIVADPEVKKLFRERHPAFFALPHAAVSSKVHWNAYREYLGEDMEDFIKEIASVS